MSHPSKDEREAYEDLCESMGEEQSLAGLLQYVTWHREKESSPACATAPAQAAKPAGAAAKFKRLASTRKRKGKEGAVTRTRGIVQPHERAVRTAINKVIGIDPPIEERTSLVVAFFLFSCGLFVN